MRTTQRVLVTGSAGYIGAVMVARLLDEGHNVVGLDTCFFEGCDLGSAPNGIVQNRKDIRDLTFADLMGFDAVIHLAALSNDPMGSLEPELTLEINYQASVNLANLAKEGSSASCTPHQLAVYRHEGFWQCMDTYREMQQLEDLWSRGDCALEKLVTC